MHPFFVRLSRALLASAVMISSAWAQAQVLEDQQTFQLPPVNAIPSFLEDEPLTLNIGDIDASLLTTIGGEILNDVVVMNSINNGGIAGGVVPAVARIYTLIHTSGTDTRALALATPVDVPVDTTTPDQCYTLPSSVQILDLNGDDTNDLAFTSSCNSRTTGGPSGTPGNVYGIAGASSDPFQVPTSLDVLGSQIDGEFIPPIILSFQPNLAAGDFDGDGVPDLAFYDGDGNIPSDLVHVLFNNGSIGPLPGQVSQINGPASPPTSPEGFQIVSGDFDGNGTQDVAISYSAAAGNDSLFAYSGDGNGGFAQVPMAQVALIPEAIIPLSLTTGDFDNNTFSDFAVTFINDDNGTTGIAVVTCSAGTPASCNSTVIAASPDTQTIPTSIDAGDFDSDGFDDLASVLLVAPTGAGGEFISSLQVRLNNGGGFNDTPDQTLTLDLTVGPNSVINQVVVNDIDACGGPDLAFTGIAISAPPAVPAPVLSTTGLPQPSITAGTTTVQNQASVAFNINEAPVADAGPDNGTRVNGQTQLGGNPTCLDPTNDAMVIAWTQTAGTPATLSDPSVANPTITGTSGGDIAFTVTCTDACGLSDSDTVTVNANSLIEGSGLCSLNPLASAGSAWAYLMFPAAIAFIAAWRKKKL
jgi:hypothetical protein